MNSEDMKKRTRAFALRLIRLVESLPNTRTADVLGKQLLRCGTSVGANYRSACRARSNAEFIAKLGIVEEEADESIYWIELMVETELIKQSRINDLLDEANQILSIVVASIITAKSKRAEQPHRNPQSDIRHPKSI